MTIAMPADSAATADLLAGHPNAVYGVDWSPDGKVIASASFRSRMAEINRLR
jgi:WD40 repeat protein